MAGRESSVRLALESSDEVRQSRTDPDVLLFYKEEARRWVYGIARFRSSSAEAVTLREELHRIAKRECRIIVDGSQHELRGSVYETFGEEAFRVQLRRV